MTVQSIERVFDIVELLSRESGGLSLTEVGKRLELHKSTVHRLLAVLKKRGYVEQDESGGLYRLGLSFVDLSSGFLNSLELKTEAEPCLRRLSQELGLTVFLATLRDGWVVYLDKVEQFGSLRKYSIIGYRRPIHCTSLGKALILGLPPEEVRDLVGAAPFEAMTPKSHRTPEELLADLETCRQRGWTFDDEECEAGVRCVGAPIFDYRGSIVAALSCSWTVYNQTVAVETVAVAVVGAAREVSHHLGFADRSRDAAPALPLRNPAV